MYCTKIFLKFISLVFVRKCYLLINKPWVTQINGPRNFEDWCLIPTSYLKSIFYRCFLFFHVLLRHAYLHLLPPIRLGCSNKCAKIKNALNMFSKNNMLIVISTVFINRLIKKKKK